MRRSVSGTDSLMRSGGRPYLGGVELPTVFQPVDDGRRLELGLHRRGRCQQAHHDAGDGGVHAGFEDAEPQCEARRDVQRRVRHVEASHHGHQHDDPRRRPQIRRPQVVGVEDGDRRDRPDVVDDGQGEEEHLERRGHA